MTVKEKFRRHIVSNILLLGIIGTLGYIAGMKQGESVDLQMRAHLLVEAANLAKEINPEQVKLLSFTSSDTGTLPFSLIREQLTSGAGKIDKIKWAYTIALRDGRLVFGPDTISMKDQDYSPPGDEYTSAPKDLVQAFKTNLPVITGPYTDKWGTFVSAFIPVMDKDKRELSVFLGVDIEGDDWKSATLKARRDPFLLIICTTILFLALFNFLYYLARKSPIDDLNLKKWIVIPVVLAMIAGVSIYSLNDFLQNRKETQTGMDLLLDRTENHWKGLVFNEAQLLKKQIIRIAQEPVFIKAFQGGDANALSALAKPAARELNELYAITHFTFFKNDKTVFWDSFTESPGNVKKEHRTMLNAERSFRDEWGLEIGERGTLTLMYVHPWTVNGTQTGYLELGMEIGDLADIMKADFDIDIVSVINKEFTTREAYENGIKTLPLEGDWDQFPLQVIDHQTLASIPGELDRRLKEGNSYLPGQGVTRRYFTLAQGDRHFNCGSIPLVDSGGRNVASLFIMSDISAEEIARQGKAYFNLSLLLLFFTGIISLLWYLSVHVERNLSTTLATLRSTVDRLALATRAGGVGIWEYDAASDTETWDDQMYRLYKIDKTKFSDGYAAWKSAIHPEDLNTDTEKFQKALLGPNDFENEFRILWPDGTVRIIRSIATVRRDESGKGLHMTGTNWDITAEKNAEAELKEMMGRAQAANEAKSNFIATMSHEIRTPMNGVIGMTGLLLDTPLTDEQRQYTEIVRKSGEDLLAIVNDILDFSKAEERSLELEILDFRLDVTLSDCVEILEAKAREKGLTLNNSIDPDVFLHVRGDPGRIRQILMNLVNNALKFTAEGNISIRTTLQSGSGTHQTVCIAITDTGIGIPADKQDSLFKPFSQLDSTSTRKYSGTGMGLAISRQLTGLMGGSIGLTSEPEKGSTFWFTVTFEKQSDAQKTNEETFAPLEGLRLLVADSDGANRMIVTSLLAMKGCTFDEAEDGTTALALLEKASSEGKPYPIAILDMYLPDINGIELGRKIKNSALLRSTELVMITSLGERGDAARCASIGFSGYLTRPLKQDLFHDCIALIAGRIMETSPLLPRGLITRHTISEMQSPD